VTEEIEPLEHAAPATATVGEPAVRHQVVDEALAALGALDSQPVEEHVRAFETAHDRLRAALSSADVPDDTGS
jgi:hypothetical protein